MADAATILSALRAYLVQVTAITTLLGTGYAARIKPSQIEQGIAGDHLTLHRLDTRDIRKLHGETFTFHDSDVQINVWARDVQDRENLAEQVRIAMRRFTGEWGGVQIRSVEKTGDHDDDFDEQDGGEGRDWRTVLRFTVWHRNLQEV